MQLRFIVFALVILIPAAAQQRLAVPLGLDAYLPWPESNPFSPAKVALGRRLFLEKQLSRDGTVSCATCHDLQRAFVDGKPVAVGIGGLTGNRKTPTLVNRGYGRAFFWDGRARTLEEQVLQPIQNPKEMDVTIAEALARLRDAGDYPGQFRLVFGRDVCAEDLARALAAYTRTILSGNSPYDKYLSGDREALGEEARQGLRLFRGKAGCIACHVGANLTDERFHNTGVGFRGGRFTDPGRAEVTKDPRDQGAFKTPTLREAARTAPYMHDGSLATLEEVIDFYDQGGRENPLLDSDIRPLRLSAEEKRALLAFLQSLSGTIQEGLPQ